MRQEIEREEVVKGYEYERGRFVNFTADELKALDVGRRLGNLRPVTPQAAERGR